MENNLINVKSKNGQQVVTSREVANNFGKDHKNILRDIRDIVENNQGSKLSLDTDLFIESTYTAGTGKKYPQYLLTRDGFSLLVMGFTGQKALEWKLKYIEAFNMMEQELKNKLKYSSGIDKVLQKNLNIADMLIKAVGVDKGIIYNVAFNDAEKETGESLQSYRQFLPEYNGTGNPGIFNATQLGKELGVKSAQVINKSLEILGFQEKVNKQWQVTEKGKEYGTVVSYENNGHTGFRILWKETALKALKKLFKDGE